MSAPRRRPSLEPFGVNREDAAALIGISPSLFDRAVEAGTMPQPRRLYGRFVWDVEELAAAFRALPHKREAVFSPGHNPWDGKSDDEEAAEKRLS